MRLLWILALGLCAGCPVQGTDCDVDNECESALVCARTHVCVQPDEVRATRTTWTINGEGPETTSCRDAFPALEDGLEFQILFKVDLDDDSDNKLGFSPVPCRTGLFSIDKLPVELTAVKLLDAASHNTLGSAVFDSEGVATIDLVAP